MLTAEWDGKSEVVADEGELFALLDRISRESREAPLLVDLVSPDGAVLSIGVGAPVTVLSFSQSPDGPYYSSRGQVEADEPSVWFSYNGAPTEFQRHKAIDADLAMRAASAFLSTGQRSSLVDWERV
ncbi:MAG TPA: Imm1 family immunity protein [Candidatus Dormibacteraeota bacterium]|jgi:hypothetical protein|nr:Imm1 family immunity protein [Candidatus Dormibacteraeota bacterium]